MFGPEGSTGYLPCVPNDTGPKPRIPHAFSLPRGVHHTLSLLGGARQISLELAHLCNGQGEMAPWVQASHLSKGCHAYLQLLEASR